MVNHKQHTGVNQALVEKYPTSKQQLVKQGLLQILGDILQKKNYAFSEELCASAQTLTVTVLS